MAAKCEFDVGTFVGQYFGAGRTRMIAEFIINKDGLLNFLATAQYVPDTVAVLVTVQPFKVGKTTGCDHYDIRVQVRNRVVIGAHRESYIHAMVLDFVCEPVCNAADFAAPTGRRRQGNLTAETVECLEKNDLMTA